MIADRPVARGVAERCGVRHESPQAILFDEPTSALDTQLGQQVMELIQSEMKARNTAAVIVSHDTRMTPYADRVVRIVDGRLGAAEPASA